MKDLSRLRHEPVEPIPDSFPLPKWLGRPSSAHQRLATGESWTSSVGPEALARPPRLEWTEEQRQIVLAALTSHWTHRMDSNEWLTISWPPEASLWSNGSAYLTEGDYCDEHEDDYRDDCEVCLSCTRSVEVVKPAEWHWEVTMTMWERDEVGGEYDVSNDSELIMRTFVDPREVDYAEGERE